MRDSVHGRVVLVTGPARGIGEALARTLAARGARLALAGMEPDRLRALAAESEAILNAEVGKAVKGEVQYDGGFFANLAQQIQNVLDKPAPSAPK